MNRLDKCFKKFMFLSALTFLNVQADTLTINGIIFDCKSSGEATVMNVLDNGDSATLSFPEKIENNGAEYMVTRIEAGAVKNIQEITTVIIPPSITSIAAGAFDNCANLQELIFSDGFESIVIEGGSKEESFPGINNVTVLYVGRNIISNGERFKDMKIREIVIGPNVTALGDKDITISGIKYSNKALFSNCTELVEIDLPESIIRIPDLTFNNCTSLRKLTLRGSLNKTVFTGDPFYFVANLEDIYCYSTEPEECDENLFYDAVHNPDISPKLHVFPEVVEAYKTHVPWKNLDIIGDLTGKISFTLEAVGAGSIYYDSELVNNSSAIVELDKMPEFLSVTTVPDHSYELKSLQVLNSSGASIPYTITHTSGEVTAEIPFTPEMKITAEFTQPITHNLTIKTSDHGEMTLAVPHNKQYSFTYKTPTGWKTGSATFNDENLDYTSTDNKEISFTTPPITRDSEVAISIYDIITEVRPTEIPSVKVKTGPGLIIIEGTQPGQIITLTSPTGINEEYFTTSDEITIEAQRGIHILNIGGIIYKVTL